MRFFFFLLIMMRGWHGRGPALLTSLCNHALAARMICWQQAFWTSLTELHSWLWKKEGGERQMNWRKGRGSREVLSGAERERGVESKGTGCRELREVHQTPSHTSVSQTFNPLCSLTQFPLQGCSRRLPVPPFFVFYFLKGDVLFSRPLSVCTIPSWHQKRGER